MPVLREDYTFPTRNYPYRYPAAPDAAASEADAVADETETAPLEAGQIHRFVLGLDPAPRRMNKDEVSVLLRDPFAELLLKRGTFPLTLRDLLSALDAVNNDPDGLPQQKCFLVAEGGQIGWTPETADVNRLFRFVIARSRGSDTRLLISASTALDSPTQFIQLLAWDSANAVYSFYERREGTWIWAGNSRHALAPETRGRGPFDSHVNGALVMKELRQPWNNWHSMSASIQDSVLAPDDPLRGEPLFVRRMSAHELETSVVRPGIERWNQARLKAARSADGARLSDVRYFFRQILETTTVNLVSSSQPSSQIADDAMLRLPSTFFLNTEALMDSIELEPQIGPISVAASLYKDSLKQYDFALTDGSYRRAGDTFFAFLVPEPAFEDLNVLAMLLLQRLISRRFAACLLMVDFPNPILSARRKQLMAYVPETARLVAGSGATAGSDVADQFVAAVEAVEISLAPESPEREFLANWRLPEADWKQVFEKRIEEYFANLKQQATTRAGFDGWVRLAESRRRAFQRRPLAEFRLTVPTTNIPPDAPDLVMDVSGAVQPTSPDTTG